MVPGLLSGGLILSQFIGGLGEMVLEVGPRFVHVWEALPLMAGLPIHFGALDEVECVGKHLVFVVGSIGIGCELHSILNLFVEGFDGFIGVKFFAEKGIVADDLGWEDAAVGTKEMLHDATSGQSGETRETVADCSDEFGVNGAGELLFQGPIDGVVLVPQAYLFLVGSLDDGDLVGGWKRW